MPHQPFHQPQEDFNAYAFAFQLGARIVTPLLIATFGGLWLDTKFGTKPWLFLGCMFVAFVLTMVTLFRESTKTMSRMSRGKKLPSPPTQDSITNKKND